MRFDPLVWFLFGFAALIVVGVLVSWLLSRRAPKFPVQAPTKPPVLKRAMTAVRRALGLTQQATGTITRTNIIMIAPMSVPAGQQTVPNPTGTQVQVPAGIADLNLTVNLATADKLAVGETLSLMSYLSTDQVTWNFVNGTNWTSYGPGGYTVTDPDGTVHINPDPTLHIAMNGLVQPFIRIVATLGQPLTAGVTVQTFA